MKRNAFATLLILVAGAQPVTGQQRRTTVPKVKQSPAADRESRTAAREQALAELDDPDRLVRAAALEDILGGRDSLLKSFAGRKVLSGTDSELKAMFVRSRLAETGRQFTMTLVDCVDQARHKTDYCSGELARGPVAVYFRVVDGSDQLMAYSSASKRLTNGYELNPGMLAGNRLQFRLSLYTRNLNHEPCSVDLTIASGEQATGSMICDTLRFAVRLPIA